MTDTNAAGRLVVGIDGGGSNTRVAVVDLSGRVLAYIEHAAAASRDKDRNAADNVRATIREALAAAGAAPGNVCGLAAGIAGYDSEEDREWVEALTDVDGLACPKWHVNDAVVAHYGALTARPGIVAVSGTGSILFAINEAGRQVRNYDYHHYAESAARFLAYDAVYEALAGRTDETDAGVVAAMLAHWQADDLDALHRIGSAGFDPDRRARDRQFGAFAPVLTDAALGGSTLARTVCDRAIRQLDVGLRMLAGHFAAGSVVPVACIGSVINTPYFRRSLEAGFAAQPAPGGCRLTLADPALPPAAGAVLYALERLGLPADAAVLGRLARIDAQS